MVTGMQATIRPMPGSTAALPLAEAGLPARVHAILADVHALAVTQLGPRLDAALDALERELFEQAEAARNSRDQAGRLDALGQLRQHRGALVPRFLASLESSLAALRSPPATAADTPAEPLTGQPLTLVEDIELDRAIVLREIARRQAQRGGTALLLLGQRFGVLAARPAFDLEQLPLGPHALCHCLRSAGEALPLDLDAQLLLYRQFERLLMDRHGEFAQQLNALLERAGVLPGLVYAPYRAPRAAGGQRRIRPPGAGAGSTRPMTGWHGQGRGPGWTRALAGLAPGAPLGDAAGGMPPAAAGFTPGTGAAPGAAPAGAGSVPPAAGPSTGQAPPTGQAGSPGATAAAPSRPAAAALPGATHAPGMALAATAEGAASAGSAHADPGMPGLDPQSAFATLQQLVAAHRASSQPAAPAAAAPPAAPPRVLPAQAIAQVLGGLQSLPLERARGQRRRTVEDVREAALARLRNEHGAGAALPPGHEDAFDLLAMLYREIGREVRTDAPAQDLLERLQVPVVRAALEDRDFFVGEQHPARELLNSVAESGAAWLGEDEADPQLVQRLEQVVERVVDAYDGDAAVFELANREVQEHHRTQLRKAEVAERRQVEAARGRDRLASAKRQAADAIGTRLGGRRPPQFVQALMSQAWADVLTLTALRHGEDSPEWRERDAATTRIVQVTCDPDAAPDPALGAQIDAALRQVGYHEDEAGAIARRLSRSDDDETTSRTELTAKLKARARLGDDGPARREPPPPRSAAEQACYEQARTLPFGTWFEFVLNQQGDMRRQRLSWYSPVTDHALFVNARGQKAGEQSLDSLARLMAAGQARVVTEDRSRLVDRAWHATLRALRGLAGRGSAAAQGAGA